MSCSIGSWCCWHHARAQSIVLKVWEAAISGSEGDGGHSPLI